MHAEHYKYLEVVFMRILIIHNFYKQYGGEDKAVEDQIRLLKSAGHHVYLYSKDNKALNLKNTIRTFLEAYYSKSTVREIGTIVDQFKPHIAHVHNIYPVISPSVYQTLSDKKVPIAQTVHNYRFICPNGLMFRKGRPCACCLEKGSYYYCGLYRCYRGSFLQSFWYADIISKAYKKGLFNKISRFIALNGFVKNKMIEKGFNEEAIEIIPHFVNINSYEITGNTRKMDYVLYIGRLSAEKGVMTLLKAMKILGNINLKIMGDGGLKHEIAEYIKANNMKNVELLGFKTGREKDYIISQAKAIVLPSECYETFGLAVVEGFSLGTAAIVSKGGALEYIIKEGVNGLCFQPGNPNDLAEKIKLIANNERLLEYMSQNAFKTYKEYYSPEIHYKRLMNLYERVITENMER